MLVPFKFIEQKVCLGREALI